MPFTDLYNQTPGDEVTSDAITLTQPTKITGVTNATDFLVEGGAKGRYLNTAVCGTNLPENVYFNDHYFLDVMKQAQAWEITAPSDGFFPPGSANVSATGFPLTVNADDQRFSVRLEQHILETTNLWTVIWDGPELQPWRIRFMNVTSFERGQFSGDATFGRQYARFDLTPATGNALQFIMPTVGVGLDKICTIPTAVESDYIVYPWENGIYKTLPVSSVVNPHFLTTVQNFEVLRFMDMMHTNGDNNATNAFRSRVEDCSWDRTLLGTVAGQDGGISIPWEMLCYLCDVTDTIGWFHLPHKQVEDEASMQRFADVIAAEYTQSTAIFEYSNEVWNSIFPTTAWNQDNGPSTHADPLTRGHQNSSFHSATFINFMRAELEPAIEVIGVLGTQGAVPSVTTQKLDIPNLPVGPDYAAAWDAVGITTYIGQNAINGNPTALFIDSLTASIAAGDTFLTWRTAQGLPAHASFADTDVITQNLAIDIIVQEYTDGSVAGEPSGGTFGTSRSVAFLLPTIEQQVTAAGGLPLVVYEGANLHTSYFSAGSTPESIALLEALHNSPQAGALMTDFLTAAQNIPGFTGPHCQFTSHGDVRSQGLFWGVKTSLSETSANFPILKAFEDHCGLFSGVFQAGATVRIVATVPATGQVVASLVGSPEALALDADGWVISVDANGVTVMLPTVVINSDRNCDLRDSELFNTPLGTVVPEYDGQEALGTFALERVLRASDGSGGTSKQIIASHEVKLLS